MTTLLTPAAARWLERHHGIATTSELRPFGLGRKALNRLVDIGALEHPARGVYVVATAPRTLEHRCRLLCCLYRGGFVTGTTAATLARCRRQPFAAAIQFSLPHGINPSPALGVRFRQSTKVLPSDRVTRPDGITVASWPRMAFDAACDLNGLDHRSLIHQLRDRELVRPDELFDIAERLCHPARRGSTTFRMSLVELDGGIADSHPEIRLGDALVRRGVPVELQVEVDVGGPVPLHVDLAVPAVKWGIELDIYPEHRSIDGHRRDTRRQRSFHRFGWQTEPVAELDVVDRASTEQTADELLELYLERSAEMAAEMAGTGTGHPSTEGPESGPSVLGRASVLG